MATALIVLGIGFWVNNWFLQGYNWIWIAVPIYWVCMKGFSKLFKMMDLVIGILIIVLIIFISQHGCSLPSLG